MNPFSKKKKEESAEIAVQGKREIMEISESMIAKLVLRGDISAMTQTEKVEYYNVFCNNLGLNPVTQPFEIITFKGKEVLYAKKAATEQLRKINGVSVYDMRSENLVDIYKVTAYGKDKSGRQDVATGAVNITGLKGENLANAIMKAETKAKRRLTLSLCGLGIMDESEYDDLPMEDVTPMPQPMEEVKEEPVVAEKFTTAPVSKAQKESAPSPKPGKATEPSPEPEVVGESSVSDESAEDIRLDIVAIINKSSADGSAKSKIMGKAFKSKDAGELKIVREEARNI
ncbi:hypothetical protein KAR91_69685 [Candidatus Pacearchaeota archaeon]|nr:hypothetical protein [Candidatus Pacearchaeota archaeon]